MRQIVFLAMVSGVLMADMSGWGVETQKEKAQKVEQDRLCKVYTKKISDYKATMRDDGLAYMTLNNYMRLQKKYCKTLDKKDNNK